MIKWTRDKFITLASFDHMFYLLSYFVLVPLTNRVATINSNESARMRGTHSNEMIHFDSFSWFVSDANWIFFWWHQIGVVTIWCLWSSKTFSWLKHGSCQFNWQFHPILKFVPHELQNWFSGSNQWLLINHTHIKHLKHIKHALMTQSQLEIDLNTFPNVNAKSVF